MSTDTTILWSTSHGLRCAIVPYFARVQLRLMRYQHTVRTEVFADEAHALVVSRRWRRLYRRPRRPAAKLRAQD